MFGNSFIEVEILVLKETNVSLSSFVCLLVR